MYTSFFGLSEKPFSITPDPRYLFMSERHGEALAHLVYGVTESGGFIQLTGEVGTGKTTLVRTLLLNRMPDNADVAVVLNPQITAQEFLATICEELGVDVPAEKDSIKALTDALNRHLLDAHADGRRVILVVDEAQNLAPAVLEQVRLLTNLETSKQKLLQIILIGQPELRELLARNDLRQLAQRITGRYHLEPLTRDETAQYIEHRLRVAGALGEVFDTAAKNEIYKLTEGVPRLINVICDRALLGAYSQESRRVSRRLIRRAAREVSGELEKSRTWQRFGIATAIFAAGVIATSIWTATQRGELAQPITHEESQPGTIEIAPAAIAAEAVPPAAEPLFAEQLELAADISTPAHALTSLFELWGVQLQSDAGDACTQARAAGLACLSQRGSWASMTQFNRPAVLTLVDRNGASHDVVLTAIDGDRATLSIGGAEIKPRVAEVTELWYGQYQLLWRPTNGAAGALVRGSRGADVLALRRNLASIDTRYVTSNADSDLYDEELENTVRQFQRDNRLDVDGLAGQQTQIIVNSLLGDDGSPRLVED